MIALNSELSYPFLVLQAAQHFDYKSAVNGEATLCMAAKVPAIKICLERGNNVNEHHRAIYIWYTELKGISIHYGWNEKGDTWKDITQVTETFNSDVIEAALQVVALMQRHHRRVKS